MLNPILVYILIGYSVVASALLIGALVFLFLKRKILMKNKCRYDVRKMSFILDPVNDDSYILNFYYGDKVLHSRKFTENDIFVDKYLPYKEFVAWLEQEA